MLTSCAKCWILYRDVTSTVNGLLCTMQCYLSHHLSNIVGSEYLAKALTVEAVGACRLSLESPEPDLVLVQSW